MSDAASNPSKRRWSAYVCPDCRLVFRIPTDHDGRGVVCPCCARMLRIPSADGPLSPPVLGQESLQQGEL